MFFKIMNWYKISQLSDIEIFEEQKGPGGHGKYYMDIGHWTGEKSSPNQIWFFNNGEIESVEETESGMRHPEEFASRGYSGGTSFSGRFDPVTGSASVIRPWLGSAKYRSVPKSILFKLYQKFPEIKQIYVF